MQKFTLALYDRLEQLEAENDMLKSEIMAISSKIDTPERFSGANQVSNSKQVKPRKIKEKKDEVGTEEAQISYQNPIDLIKSAAARITISDYESKSIQEKNRLLASIDEDSALETISWSILNSGMLPQIQQEIDF